MRQGLKKTNEIAEYINKNLLKAGYETETNMSAKSKSCYITILNYNDDETAKIRISDHDLPPTYDNGRISAHDFDIRSENVKRAGNAGTAEDYAAFLTFILAKKGIEVKKSWQAIKKENEKKLANQKYENEKADYEIEYKNAFAKASAEYPELARAFEAAKQKLAEKRAAGLSSKKAKNYRSNISFCKKQIEEKMAENGFVFK